MRDNIVRLIFIPARKNTASPTRDKTAKFFFPRIRLALNLFLYALRLVWHKTYLSWGAQCRIARYGTQPTAYSNSGFLFQTGVAQNPPKLDEACNYIPLFRTRRGNLNSSAYKYSKLNWYGTKPTSMIHQQNACLCCTCEHSY